ncbi:DUF590-domain-containing protein [Gloeophyllum trabeum ATCC 11539]|uniref:DUF590-domain-containing protein n=1 Tax=Gloeophyllum trabeum (strain ATCC 11539 / FP-39264 / Madison 617) TaxID=670483 RepID=S7Q9Y8_GLOTA|nr:DUF590-domain-containing protein [Gloeophyllum trabeum ATCC 11539]EPQ56716.1 DUF590-domain-containing protein [Gloeophyllum trabeum ATCC 11539]
MPPQVDLVVVFRASSPRPVSKPQAREDAEQAERQYTNLIDTLNNGGLKAVGRRGENAGQLLVLVWCPSATLVRLVHSERYSDFLSGLPITRRMNDLDNVPTLSPADRLRLIHAYITSTPSDGGLGVLPASSHWDRVESVMALHDHEFNEHWIRSWTTRQSGSVHLDKIREQFGESVALYFAFLSTYTKSLLIPSALGIAFYYLGTPYSPAYSILVLLYSVTFVEYWRVHERMLSVRWGTRGSFRVEKRRADYKPGFAWWRRELRTLASVPVIACFAGVLALLLTAMFVFEAFVTQLWSGPGQKWIGFTPTILFIALVPRFLSFYQRYAVRLTNWENHAHQSSYNRSLTLKTFSLSAIVAYLGLALSAFIYVPFGETVMQNVQMFLEKSDVVQGTGFLASLALTPGVNATKVVGDEGKRFWVMDTQSARRKLNPSRLQNQMYAYTVTNQIINFFLENVLPFAMRAVDSVRNGRPVWDAFTTSASSVGRKGKSPKKRVVFEDESRGEGKDEREFLEEVRREVALPEYEVFGDFSEMVTQFGYVVLWSSIWPLAPVMAWVNNVIEQSSDAFKITVHNRRPIPVRTDTIGPWLDTLTFITWLGALTNSALVYLFRPCCGDERGNSTTMVRDHPHTVAIVGNGEGQATRPTANQLVVTATLIALTASHGFIVVRALVRHLMENIVWKGSKEVQEAEVVERQVKERYLESIGIGKQANLDKVQNLDGEADANGRDAFWVADEGLEEIRKAVKDA